MKVNIYGRRLPVDQQEATGSSECVDCTHPHWGRLEHRYVRCAMCDCENIGSNNLEIGEGDG